MNLFFQNFQVDKFHDQKYFSDVLEKKLANFQLELF